MSVWSRLGIGAAMTAIAVGGAIAMSNTASREPVAPTPSLEQDLAAIATKVRARLPQQVDSVTTATGIRAEGRTLIYGARLSREVPAGGIISLEEAAQAADLQRTCAAPAMRALIQRGANVRYQYEDEGGQRFETIVDECSV